MDRRDFLKLSMFGALSPVFLKTNIFSKLADETQAIYGGWVYSASGRDAFIQRNENAFLSQLDDQIRGTGAGKVVCLWPYMEKVTGKPLTPYYQETGDCVGCAYARGIDILASIQCYRELIPQRWVAPVSSEIIYGGGKHGRNLENPPHSPMEEGSATFFYGGRLKLFCSVDPDFSPQ